MGKTFKTGSKENRFDDSYNFERNQKNKKKIIKKEETRRRQAHEKRYIDSEEE